MRALVIGASGQVGGALVAALAARGHVVVGTYATVPVHGAVQLDLHDHHAVKRLVLDARPDWIFCPGGLASADWCEDHPDDAVRVNLVGPLVAARAGASVGAGFAYYSTDFVFDGARGPYGEEDPPRPLSVYGESKLRAEQALLQEIGRALVIRTALVYGAERQEKGFVYQLLRRCRSGGRMRAATDLVSSPTYNEDLARASVELAERGAGGLFHVAGPDALDRYTFSLLICRAFGVEATCVEPVTAVALGQRAVRPLRGGLRSERARRLFGITVRPVKTGLVAMRQAIECEGFRPGSG
jgi:dTDP-4-dehydrorhamnose reductase